MAGPVPFLTSVMTNSVGTVAFTTFSSGIRAAMEGRLPAAMSSAAASVNSRRTGTRRMLLRCAGQAHQHPVQAQHVVGRVRNLTALGKRGLIEQELGQLLEVFLIGLTVEVLHDRVAGVDFERRLRLGD